MDYLSRARSVVRPAAVTLSRSPRLRYRARSVLLMRMTSARVRFAETV